MAKGGNGKNVRSVQLADRLAHVVGAHAGIALDHSERYSAAHVHVGEEVDPACLQAVSCCVFSELLPGMRPSCVSL